MTKKPFWSAVRALILSAKYIFFYTTYSLLIIIFNMFRQTRMHNNRKQQWSRRFHSYLQSWRFSSQNQLYLEQRQRDTRWRLRYSEWPWWLQRVPIARHRRAVWNVYVHCNKWCRRIGALWKNGIWGRFVQYTFA